MKYKDFVIWCNERACDGQWDMDTAMVCIETIIIINSVPFWKRKEKKEKWNSLSKSILPIIELIERNKEK